MPAHRSFSVGGSIARRPSPGRNCSRACRVAPAPIVAGILTPRSQNPATDDHAKRQTSTITIDKSSIANSQSPHAIDRTFAFSMDVFFLCWLSFLLFRFTVHPAFFRPFRPFSSLPPPSPQPFNNSLYFRFFQLYFRHCQFPRNSQLIAPKPLATNITTQPLANLINFETLFFISSGCYARQPPIRRIPTALTFSPAKAPLPDACRRPLPGR
jgi:hypothetical protein